MEENFVNNVIELYKNGQWQEITERYHDYPERNKLLWVFPSEGNFRFLRTCLADLNCDEIISVGCGSGLLEWMIVQATGKVIIKILACKPLKSVCHTKNNSNFFVWKLSRI